MIVFIHKCRPIDHPLPLVAWGIMLLQGMLPWKKDSYSHLAISYFSTTGNQKFADSTVKGVRDMRYLFFRKKYRIVESKSLALPMEYNQFLLWFESHEGKDYDRKQIFGIFWKLVGVLSFNKHGHGLKKLTCNELVLALIMTAFKRTYRDTDDFDLLMTWNEVLDVTDQT